MGFWQKLKALITGEPEATAPAAAPPAGGAPRAQQPEPPAVPKRVDPYAATGVMGLSPAEFRRRAKKVNPWRSAWIGRVDVIPPASDERTALVDRGLVLNGYFTVDQLRDIHAVGDQWLEISEARSVAALHGAASADAAIAQRRADAIALKLQKKAAAKARREAEAVAKAHRHATDIIFVGRGYSGRLSARQCQVEDLRRLGLPVLATPADVAQALEITVPRLRWLAWHAEAVAHPHYIWFTVPKRNGGVRHLAAPKASLAQAQRWILDQILDRLPVEPQAHGFVRGRSTVSNARPHVGRGIVINLDLQDFFPTISFPRVRGVFERMGYAPAAATLLAMICTESPRRKVRYDGEDLWVAVGARALPQGACTSPAISNQIARRLDRRLVAMATKHGWIYTRYADDLTFSASRGGSPNVGLMMARVRHIVSEEGFALNPKKGRVQRRSSRQEVTGIVVNDKLSVPRSEVRRLRAILHQAARTGLAAQNREGRPGFEAWFRGKLAYLAMVDPAKGRPMMAELDRILGGR